MTVSKFNTEILTLYQTLETLDNKLKRLESDLKYKTTIAENAAEIASCAQALREMQRAVLEMFNEIEPTLIVYIGPDSVKAISTK